MENKQLDIRAIAESLLQALADETKHFHSVAEGVKLLFNRIQKEAEALNGREEVQHSEPSSPENTDSEPGT